MGERRVVVIGVGNELYGDDGVGVVVARALMRQGDLPVGVEVIEGHTGGLNLLFDLEGAQYAILIDAVDMARSPGEVRVFTPQEAQLVAPGKIASLHHIGLEQVLALGQLVELPPHIHIVGIQPQRVELGAGLSPAVAHAVPQAVQRVRELLAGPIKGDP